MDLDSRLEERKKEFKNWKTTQISMMREDYATKLRKEKREFSIQTKRLKTLSGSEGCNNGEEKALIVGYFNYQPIYIQSIVCYSRSYNNFRRISSNF